VFRFVKKPWDNDEIRTALADAATLASRLATRTPAPPEAPKVMPTVVVVDPAQALARVLETLVGKEASVKHVASVREAAKLLQSLDCAAIVADLAAGKDDLVKLFRVVKAKRPETLSILIAEEADADLVADLINQAQIYRFLPKPANPRDVRDRVVEALRHHAEFKPMRPPPSGLSQHIGGARPGKPVPGAR
jgi:DNA-binding NtrC family response regulator